MRCLQCGSQLALLKKFTDGEFCSTDHRTFFYDTQQKLIIERLAESARKLKRHKLVTKQAEALVTPPAPPPEPIPAAKVEDRFPPFAVLLPLPVLDALVVRNHPYEPASGFAPTPPDLLLIPPTYRRVQAKRHALLAGLMPTFLSTRSWNRRKQIEVKPAAASGMQPLLPKIPGLRRLGSVGIGMAADVPGNFDKTNPIGARSFGEPNHFVGELSGFGRMISQPEASLSEKNETSNVQAPGQLIGLTVPQPSCFGAVSGVGDTAGVVPAAQNARPALPGLVTHPVDCNGLNAIRNPFRMRPRGPVGDSSVAQFCTIKPNPVEAGQASLSASFTRSVPKIELLGPAIRSRLFRPRPCGGVLSSMILEMERIEPKSGAMSAGSLSIPSLATVESPTLIPVFPGRFFHMRARGPVRDHTAAGSASAGTADLEPFAAAVRRPSYPADLAGNFAPCFLDRGFRMRPRGAVAARHLPEFETIVSVAVESPALQSSKPSLSTSIVGDYAPVFVDRGFRARPRGPVQSPGLAEFERALPGDPAAFLSPPSFGLLPPAPIGECSPKPVRRFYRIGPKGPALSASLYAHESIAEGFDEPLLSAPALAGLPCSIVGEFSPTPLQRFFRARPRGPVEGNALAPMERIAAGASAELVSAPATGTLPAYLIGQCAPNAVVRFFRARPRGPVDVPSISAYEEIVPGPHAALVSPPLTGTMPLGAIGDCAPDPLSRFFRARPRGPIDAVLPAMERIEAGAAVGLASKPARGSFPTVSTEECAPSPVMRFFRPRPRGPVDRKTLGLMSDAGFAAAMESMPLLAALPASVVGGLAPVQLDKPYKMRPRGPVQASRLASFHPVSTGEAAALPRASQVPPLNVLDGPAFEPLFLNRFYRVRPRGPVQPGSALYEALTAGDPALLTPTAALPSMPAVLMRQARTSSRDRGPRMRPPGPKPNSGTPNFDRLDEGGEDARVPHASMAGLPDGVLSAPEALAGYLQFAPSAVEFAPVKPARMIPVLSPAQCELIIHPPLFFAEMIVDYRPSLVEIRHAFEETHKPSWFGRLARFWSEARWDLKWATAAAPILLGVLIHSSITGLPASRHLANVDVAAMLSNPLPPLKTAVNARWSGLRHELVGRAAVDFQEDFTRGLRFWTGDANWSNSWTYDIHGGVKPGTLAIYTPSIGMSDYDVEFTGGIESKSLGWVFRAADTRSYYAVKLTTIIPGPMPTVALVRSAVIDGKEGPPTQIPLPFPVSKDQVYRVRMEVSGQFFTVFVQGHVVAFWSDERLRTGGIGFFSAKGEQSRLIAVRVSHQFDALGRLCASLALEDKAAKQSGVSTNESQK